MQIAAPGGDMRRMTFGSEGISAGLISSPLNSGVQFGETFATPARKSDSPFLFGCEKGNFEEICIPPDELSKTGMVFTWGSGGLILT